MITKQETEDPDGNLQLEIVSSSSEPSLVVLTLDGKKEQTFLFRQKFHVRTILKPSADLIKPYLSDIEKGSENNGSKFTFSELDAKIDNDSTESKQVFDSSTEDCNRKLELTDYEEVEDQLVNLESSPTSLKERNHDVTIDGKGNSVCHNEDAVSKLETDSKIDFQTVEQSSSAKKRNKSSNVLTYNCRICGKLFTSSEELKKHSENPNYIAQHQPPACHLCTGKNGGPLQFTSRAASLVHMNSVHNKSEEGKEEVDKDKLGVSSCPVCNLTFAQQKLITHVREHTGELKYLCCLCGRYLQMWGKHTGCKPNQRKKLEKQAKDNKKKKKVDQLESSKSKDTFSGNVGQTVSDSSSNANAVVNEDSKALVREPKNSEKEISVKKEAPQEEDFWPKLNVQFENSETEPVSDSQEAFQDMDFSDDDTDGASRISKAKSTRKGIKQRSTRCKIRKRLVCKICDTTFPDIQALKVHRQNPDYIGSVAENILCERCENSDGTKLQFNSKAALVIHNYVTHEANAIGVDEKARRKPFWRHKCPMCDMMFDRVSVMTTHVREHTGEQPFMCCKCGQLLRKWGVHNGCSAGQNFVKALEKRVVETPKSLPRKERVHSLKCTFCQNTFSNDQEFNQHRHNPNFSLLTEFPKCDSCKLPNGLSLQFNSKAAWIVHNDMTHKSEEAGSSKVKESQSKVTLHCPMCSADGFPSENFLIAHVKQHTGEHRFICCVCGQHLSLWKKHGACLGFEATRYQCKQCSEKFATRQELLTHQEGHRLQCNYCPKKFLSSVAANRHLETDHIHDALRCHLCDKLMRNDAHLKGHLRDHRFNKDKKRQCRVCGELVVRMNVHLKTHKEKKTFSCDQCPMTFASLIRLSHHYAKHTNERPFSCDHCSKKFKTRTALSRHLDTHNRTKFYVCDECGHKSTSSGNLKIHKRIHTSEKQFFCQICGQGFNYKASLVGHMRSQHNSDTPSSVEQLSQTPMRPVW